MYTFSYGGTNFKLGFFPQRNFPLGGKFPGGEIARGNYTLGEFARIPKQNSFYMSCFLFFVSISRVELLRVIVRGKFSPRLNCPENISVERGFLHGGAARFPGII
jgi:hypothetical protein